MKLEKSNLEATREYIKLGKTNTLTEHLDKVKKQHHSLNRS